MSSPRKSANKKYSKKSGAVAAPPPSSQSAASAAPTSPSGAHQSEKKIRSKLTKALDLETRLSALSATKNSESEASKLRIQLCEIFSDILLSDATFSARKDVCGRLWRSCFYGRIVELRNRIAKEKQRRNKKQANESGKDNKKVEEYEGFLKIFIKDAVVLYDYLLNRYHEFILEAQGHSISQTQQSQVSLPKHPLPSGVIPTLHKLYIHLGDLHRYSSNFNAAETAYLNAALIAPGKGNPYNQLAVVAQLKDAASSSGGKLAHSLPAVALYWYCRSLLAKNDPFLTAKSNIERLFMSNRSWITSQPTDKSSTCVHGIDIDTFATSYSTAGLSREQIRPVKAAASRMFLSRFVDLHWDFFNTSSSVDCTKMKKVLDLFDTLLEESSFSDGLLIKMACINAFSLWNLYQSKDSKSSGNKVVVALANMLAFGSSLASHVKNTIDKLDSKSGTNNTNSSSSSPTFIRLLGPFLLHLDFISYLWLCSDKIAEVIFSRAFHSPSGQIETEHLSNAHKSFWCNVATLSNTFNESTALASVFDGHRLYDIYDEAKSFSVPKEFKFVRGFTPFDSFAYYGESWNNLSSSQCSSSANDDETKQNKNTPTSSVYISAEEVTQGLDLVRFSQGSNHSHTSNNSKGSKGNYQNFKEDTSSKLFRFVRILKEHSSLRSDDSKACTGTFLNIDEQTWKVSCKFLDADLEQSDDDDDNDDDDDDDDPMTMDVDYHPHPEEAEKREEAENESKNNGRRPCAMTDDACADDVIVYKASESGKGPALLVPGALLLGNRTDELKPDCSLTVDDNLMNISSFSNKQTPFMKVNENASAMNTNGGSNNSNDNLLKLSLLLEKSSKNSIHQRAASGSTNRLSDQKNNKNMDDSFNERVFTMPQSLPPKRNLVNPPPGFAPPSIGSISTENMNKEKSFHPNESYLRQIPDPTLSTLEQRLPLQQFGQGLCNENSVDKVASTLSQRTPPPGFNQVNMPGVSRNNLFPNYPVQSNVKEELSSSEDHPIRSAGYNFGVQPTVYQPHQPYNLHTANPFATPMPLGTIDSSGKLMNTTKTTAAAFEATKSHENGYYNGMSLSMTDTHLSSSLPTNHNNINPEDNEFGYGLNLNSRDALGGSVDFFGLKSLGIFSSGDNFFEARSDVKDDGSLPTGNSLNINPTTQNPFVAP